MNPYEVLGLKTDANAHQIAAAYRNAARRHHPDAGGSAEQFRTIQAAFEILRDPVRRKRYDETGQTDDPTGKENQPLTFISEILHSLLATILKEGRDPEQEDLIGLLKLNIDENIKAVEKSIEDRRKVAAKLAAVAKRFTAKGPDNLLSDLVRGPIAGLEANIAQQTQRLAVMKEAHCLVKKASYTWERADKGTAHFIDLRTFSEFVNRPTFWTGTAATP